MGRQLSRSGLSAMSPEYVTCTIRCIRTTAYSKLTQFAGDISHEWTAEAESHTEDQTQRQSGQWQSDPVQHCTHIKKEDFWSCFTSFFYLFLWQLHLQEEEVVSKVESGAPQGSLIGVLRVRCIMWRGFMSLFSHLLGNYLQGDRMC